MATTNWNIDLAHSSITFSVRHMVFAKVKGRFGNFNGTIDRENSSVAVVIDAASVDTGVADRDRHLRSPDFFDVVRFPQVTFVSTHVERNASGYRVTGNLTIRDITRRVVLDVEDGGEASDPWGNRRVAFSLRTSLDRRDYGLTWNQVLEAGGVLVGEKVDVEIEIQAVQASAERAA